MILKAGQKKTAAAYCSSFLSSKINRIPDLQYANLRSLTPVINQIYRFTLVPFLGTELSSISKFIPKLGGGYIFTLIFAIFHSTIQEFVIHNSMGFGVKSGHNGVMIGIRGGGETWKHVWGGSPTIH